MDVTAFALINELRNEIERLHKKINDLENKITNSEQIYKSYLIRLINQYPISDEMIRSNIPYLDLTPEEAYDYYQDEKNRFIFLDVSDSKFNPPSSIRGRIHIPLDQLSEHIEELKGILTPIMIISEDGTKSITGCHQLSDYGFLYLHNISGGHLYWPGHQQKKVG